MERIMLMVTMCVIAVLMLLCCAGGIALLVMRYNGLPGDIFLDVMTVGLIVCAAVLFVAAVMRAVDPETTLEVANLH